MWKKPKHEFHIPGFNLGHCQDVIAANAGCYHGHHTMPSQPSQDAIPVMAMRTLRPSPKSPIIKKLETPGITVSRHPYLWSIYIFRVPELTRMPPLEIGLMLSKDRISQALRYGCWEKKTLDQARYDGRKWKKVKVTAIAVARIS